MPGGRPQGRAAPTEPARKHGKGWGNGWTSSTVELVHLLFRRPGPPRWAPSAVRAAPGGSLPAATRKAATCATRKGNGGKCMPGGRPQGQGCPDRTSQKVWKRLAKTRQPVQPLNWLPAFSPPSAAPAGPERGPRRPSSLGAVPLGNLENYC